MPVHQHDCEVCRFCGTFEFEDLMVDVYVCQPPGRGEISQSLIGRFGSDGPEYWSHSIQVLRHLRDRGFTGCWPAVSPFRDQMFVMLDKHVPLHGAKEAE